MKFKRTRALLDDLNSIIKGWYFKMEGPFEKHPGGLENWHIIADFSTKIKIREKLKETNQHRIDNMKLCCEMIDCIRIRPGHIFSLKGIIGEITEERGFKKGPMIIKGKLDLAPGGGLCQVSTALFNGALLANLDILEKHNHSTDIWGENRFIDLGRDAVYVYARKDLKFKNNLNDDIIIRLIIDEQALKLTCKVLCQKRLDGTIEVESKVLEELHYNKSSQKFNSNKNNSKESNDQNKQKYGSGWLVLTERYFNKELANKKTKTYMKLEKYEPFLKESNAEGDGNES